MADSLDYPELRQSRSGPSFTGGGATATATAAKPIPRVRLWSAYCHETGTDAKALVASPRFQGPAVITHLTLRQRRGGSDNIAPTIGLWKHVSQYASASGLSALSVVAGVCLFENDFQVDTAFTPPDTPGYYLCPLDIAHQGTVEEIRVPVLESEFFLALTYIPWRAETSHLAALVRVVEGLAPEDIPNFL